MDSPTTEIAYDPDGGIRAVIISAANPDQNYVVATSRKAFLALLMARILGTDHGHRE